MNKSSTTGISHHSTAGTLFSKTSDKVRQISLCATSCCNSTAFTGRLMTPAENLDPAPDIFLIVAILELTHKEQLWWILAPCSTGRVHKHGICAGVRHVSEHAKSPQEKECSKVSWAGQSNSGTSKDTEVCLPWEKRGGKKSKAPVD